MQQSYYEYEDSINTFDYQYDINFLSQQQKPQPIIKMKDITLESYLVSKMKQDKLKQSRDCQYELSQLDSEFIKKIQDHDYKKYFEVVILPKKSLFRQISTEQIMQHQIVDLDKALTIGAFQDMQRNAKLIFQLMLQFSQDQSSKFPPMEQVTKILSLIEDRNQQMIDELYFQIIKQIIHNNSTKVMYVQLLTLICSLYPPSQPHLLPFLNFFYFNAVNEKTPIIHMYWKFLIKRICKTYNQRAPIPIFPTEEQILSIMNLRPMTINVNVYGENQLEYEIEPDSRVVDIVDQIKVKLQVTNITICMIQMLAGQIEEFYLLDQQLVVEIVWEQQRSINQIKERVLSRIKDSQQIIESIDGSCKFVIKASITNINDVQNLSLAYMVTIEDYLNGQFTLNTKEIQLIAALKLTADSGSSSEHCKLYFDYKLYVPLYKRSEFSEDIWLRNILKLYLKQDKITKREARQKIVDYFKSQFTFLASRFPCKMYETQDKLQKIILHVGYNGTSCSSVNTPRQPFMTNLTKVFSFNNTTITLQKGTRTYYFKFANPDSCFQALTLIKTTQKEENIFQQYNTAFI